MSDRTPPTLATETLAFLVAEGRRKFREAGLPMPGSGSLGESMEALEECFDAVQDTAIRFAAAAVGGSDVVLVHSGRDLLARLMHLALAVEGLAETAHLVVPGDVTPVPAAHAATDDQTADDEDEDGEETFTPSQVEILIATTSEDEAGRLMDLDQQALVGIYDAAGYDADRIRQTIAQRLRIHPVQVLVRVG